MPHPGQSAVVVLVPELDPLLDAVAARWPGAVRPGIPAHLTLLHPFLAAARLTDQTVARCRDLWTGPLDVVFERVTVEPTMVATAPLPDTSLRALTRAFVDEWPECPPYGGRFGPDPAPHVTLALGAEPQRNREIAAFAARSLPVVVELRTAVLVELTEHGWDERARFDLQVGERGER